ncbi:MAG: NADPH:quinone oxidoreductase 2 [uncultured Rubrobacteraceae bacterium]|uniref:NADPH:quinone oxidoreductase 2 n=1 Tax=uncultured Rubrobacteraceae bacterium TaxID=349277 RepID=A0A6J4QU24_9ACTN|nr:MAG: NADPH:quinone oxidoreductase 2 [uncultured Rubrobacteraceae bacterium]
MSEQNGTAGGMIVVTGASGTLGRAVVERLLERVPAERIGASVRDPGRARDLAERGVRVRRGDFGDPESLAHAFEGASRVLVVSVDRLGEDAVRLHRAAIDAAKAAGAGRIFYTSHVGADPASAFPPGRDHAATEAALRDSGVAHTSLRNGFYAATAAMQLTGALETGELAVPEDGPVDWTTQADLADATAVALTDGDLVEPILNLTGAEAIDMAGIAEIASGLTGRPIRRVVVPDDEYRAGLVARGLREPQAAMFLTLFVAARRGAFARVDPTLGRLIGRPPTPLRDVLEAAASKATVSRSG